MRLSSAAILLVLTGSGLALSSAAPAAEAVPGAVILDTSSFWRVHYTVKPPVVKTEQGVEVIPFPAKWIMRDTPLPPDDWPGPDFDDLSWARFPGVPNLSVRKSDAKSPFVALACMRGKFAVTDPAKVKGLTFSLAYRGGAIVYVNGKEVARGHLTKGGGLSQLAEEYAGGGSLTRKLSNVKIPSSVLRKGVNVLAIEVHRTSYDPKDVKKEKRGRIIIDRGHCGPESIRLEAASPDGVVAGIARPKGFQLWNSDSLRVDTDMDYGDPNEKLRPVRIVGSLNGAFSGKVIVGSDGPIKGLSARMSDLKSKKGGSIPASAVQIRYPRPDWTQVRSDRRYLALPACFDALAESPPAEVAVTKKRRKRWSSRLIESPGVSPSFGAVQPVWITVNVPGDAKPGSYSGTLAITADGEKASVPVTIEVHPWKLPDPQDFVTWADIVQSPESVAMQYEVPFWSDEHFGYLEKSLKLLGQVGSKAAYIHLICRTNAGNAETMVRWIEQPGGTYKYDLTPMEKYLDRVLKYQGRPAVVCFYVWDTYLEGGQGGAEQYAGAKVKAGRAAHKDKGPLVTVLDPATGKVEMKALAMYSTPDKSRPQWKPLMEEIRKRMKKRGLADSMMIGISTDNRPTKEVVDFFKDILPGVPWVSQAHSMPGDLYGVPVKYLSGVWQGGKFPADPSVKRTYGWKRTFAGLRSKEFSPAGGGVLVHHPRNYWTSVPVTSFRLIGEMNIAGQQRGFARLGGDFWDVIKDKRGRGHWLATRYPETSWRNLDIRSRLFAVGKDGAISTHRFEMLREGIQECEARIFIEKAILAGTITGELAKRCQKILDERIPPMRIGLSTLTCTGAWTTYAYIDNSWWQIPGVLGYYWYVGSGWQERSGKLYAAAAEVSRAVDGK